MIETGIKMHCLNCGKQKPIQRFFSFKEGGKKDIYCKDCRLIGCSDSQPWTYFPIMQLFDIPYIETVWFEKMMWEMRVATNTYVYNSIFGKYYSTMRLHHWRHFGFKDSQRINKMERQSPFSYTSALQDLRHFFLDRDIPEEYYDTIGLE